MKAIELNWLKLLQRLRRPRGAIEPRFLMMNLDELDPLPLGPGWFDSSWELEQGLEVREDVTLDAALKTRFEDAMIQCALARLRSDAARTACQTSGAPKMAVEPSGPVPPRTKGPVDGRTDNLIEFDMAEVGAWKLPSKRGPATMDEGVELALTLV